MISIMKEFMIKIFQIPVGWRIWLLVLMAANMVVPLFFINHIEALDICSGCEPKTTV